MTPFQRRLRDALSRRQPVQATGEGLTEAAVAVIVGTDPEAVLLIRRAERAGDPWSGHMGLPGGRRHPDDADLLATAIRETAEEVGIHLERGALLGSLDDVAPRTTRLPILARPFVFAVEGRPALHPNHEVALTHWAPVEDLADPARYGDVSMEIAPGVSRPFPAYMVGGHIVWGMTERMLTGLLQVCEARGG